MAEKAAAMEQPLEISMRLTLPLSAVVTDSVLKNSAQEVEDCYKNFPPPKKNQELTVWEGTVFSVLSVPDILCSVHYICANER